jgi:hypothetical protein
MPIDRRHFASDSTERLAYRLARVAVVVGLALASAVARGQTMDVTRRGHALSQVLDAMNVERLWLPSRDVDWKKMGLRQFAGAWPAGVRFFAHNRAAPPRRNGRIDARQAVGIAERFVRENGCTDFVPDDLSRLVPESIEFSANPRDWVKGRHNELKPQAVGYRKGSPNDPEGWTVGFALVDPMNETRGVGRAVTMDAKGRRARVEHMGVDLKGLEPRPD